MATQVPNAMEPLCLRDKVIIVTGGNKGIVIVAEPMMLPHIVAAERLYCVQ